VCAPSNVAVDNITGSLFKSHSFNRPPILTTTLQPSCEQQSCLVCAWGIPRGCCRRCWSAGGSGWRWSRDMCSARSCCGACDV
jgi:hypothetical protein